MPRTNCTYFMCKNRNVKIPMFRFPRDERLMRLWLEHCGNMTLTHLSPERLRNRYICIEHFDDKYIRNRDGSRVRLHKNAVPKPYNDFDIPILEPSPHPIPGHLKVLQPIKVYKNKKAPDKTTDYFQWHYPKKSKETNQGCNPPTRLSYRALLDQTKIVIAKVYHYFEQEYEELKKSFEGLELTPLSKFRQRTALATGVSETTVAEVLQEEARRQEQQRDDTRRDESPARKRPRQTDSSSDEDSDSLDDDDEPSTAVHEEVTLQVKEEPLETSNEEPEIYVEVKTEPGVSGANDALADPISIDFKTEPQDEEATTSNETVVTQRVITGVKGKNTKRSAVAPASTSVLTVVPPASPGANAPPAIRRANAPPFTRTPNVPPVARSPNAPPMARTPNVPPASQTSGGQPVPPNIDAPPSSQRRQLLLLDDGDIKMEEIDIEEGFS